MTQRTDAQNRAIHLYCAQLADALDREGHTLQNVVERIKKAEIRPTQENIKETVFKPMAKALFGVDSTTKLTTSQVDRVYEMVNAFIGREFHLYIPFPCDDQKQLENLGGYKTQAGMGTEGVDYPEYNGGSIL